MWIYLPAHPFDLPFSCGVERWAKLVRELRDKKNADVRTSALQSLSIFAALFAINCTPPRIRISVCVCVCARRLDTKRPLDNIGDINSPTSLSVRRATCAYGQSQFFFYSPENYVVYQRAISTRRRHACVTFAAPSGKHIVMEKGKQKHKPSVKMNNHTMSA